MSRVKITVWEKFKKYIKIATIFSVGLVAGYVLYSYTFAESIVVFRDNLRVYLSTEEGFRATREERKGNLDSAIYHQRNKIRFSSPEYTETFSFPLDGEDEVNFLLKPLQYFVLGKIIQESDPFGRGSELGESIERGRLAYLYEKKGLAEAALREWQKAAKIAGNDDIDKIKQTTITVK